MRRTVESILSVGVLATVLALPAPAAAFHGASWTGQGTATLVGTGHVEPLVATWSGQQGFGGLGVLSLQIGDAAPVRLQMTEQLVNVFFKGCIEYVDPYRQEALAAGPAVAQLEGVMRNDLCSPCFCEAENDFWGHLLNVWLLQVHVRGDKDTLADG